MIKKWGLLTLLFCAHLVLKAQYISEVLEYIPAPGQFVNVSPWGFPSSAPSIIGGVTGTMTLGSFGGYVIFKFSNPVENDPQNPFGVDFTVFGNPLPGWVEPAVIYIMKDENTNDLPDDTWYELAGSDYFFSSSIHHFEVTYRNPKNDSTHVSWVDNLGDSGYVLKTSFHGKKIDYPISDSFPTVTQDEYTLSGSKIAANIVNDNGFYTSNFRSFGYADNQARGVAPYTVPDNPYTPEVENSGGDAFDISWAVDDSGQYVDLNQIDFIKVQNAVLANAGWLGEVSTEITGAVDVEPNNTITGIDELIVLKELPDTIATGTFQVEAFVFHQGRWQKDDSIIWATSIPGVAVDEKNVLKASKASGELTLTASLADNPDVTASVSTILHVGDSLLIPTDSIPQNDTIDSDTTLTNDSTADTTTSLFNVSSKEVLFELFPNPTSDFIFIKNADNAAIDIYDISGRMHWQIDDYTSNKRIDLMEIPNGWYVIEIRQNEKRQVSKFLKQ